MESEHARGMLGKWCGEPEAKILLGIRLDCSGVLSPSLLPCRNMTEMMTTVSLQIVGIIEPLIQHADWFFPGGRLCAVVVAGWDGLCGTPQPSLGVSAEFPH